MKFSPNIKIPDSLKRVLKRESTPTPLQEPRRPIKRNPKDNIPLNFRERSNARNRIGSHAHRPALIFFANVLRFGDHTLLHLLSLAVRQTRAKICPCCRNGGAAPA